MYKLFSNKILKKVNDNIIYSRINIILKILYKSVALGKALIYNSIKKTKEEKENMKNNQRKIKYRNKICTMNGDFLQNKNNQKGITLVALIITVIVLLVLTVISIRLIINGEIINKAKRGTESYLESEIKEKIATAYQECKMSQYSNSITFEEALIHSGLNGAIINEEESTVTYKSHSFFVDSNGDIIPLTQVDIINEKIGEVVQGYSAQNLEWKIFYADASETFLISSSTAEAKSFSIPTKRKVYSENEQEYIYKGSEDVRNSVYGAKWNKKWLEKCNGQEQTITKAKATAYMCDPYNWEEYKTGPANYAVGGPTIELLIQSYNKIKNKDLSIENDDVTAIGYASNKPSELSPANALDGFYNIGRNYFIASPSTHQDPSIVRGITYLGALAQFYNTDANIFVRPIVSIPTSKVSIDGDIITVKS